MNGSTNEVGPEAVAGAYFREVSLAAIVLNPRQTREVFDGERLEKLGATNWEVRLDRHALGWRWLL